MSEGGSSKLLDSIREKVRKRFDAQKRVLSFREYLDLARAHPRRYTRDAARYLKDCLDHFGTYEVREPGRTMTRWRLFDLDFTRADASLGDSRRRRDRLAGHEDVQRALYRVLEGFEREGRANRLLLLHGPNGSAKSTFTACLMQGLEAYSDCDEGALYRFSWVFPKLQDGPGIGFSTASDELSSRESFAHLPEGRIVAKIQSSVREHPLLLLPRAERRAFIEEAYGQAGLKGSAPDWVWSGELGRQNQQIFEALLNAYRGDLDRLLAHVQVERFTISRRYRVGAVTIGPEMTVDASERQITVDRSLEALPASLSALTLFEPFGELVDASSGIIEYSDLLKRPLDAWKYLLLAIETGEVSLQMSNLPLNAVMIASSNELHLGAFRQHPEYNSFRGRIVRIRMPYLLNVDREQEIYDGQIVPQIAKHVAPHTTYLAALWSVLTRVYKPNLEVFEKSELGVLAASLTPLEKVDLVAAGTIPGRLEGDEAKVLTEGIDEVRVEGSLADAYEGLTGASPREIRSLLLNAAANGDTACLSPVDLLAAIEALCERDDYDFLQQEPKDGYLDHRAAVEVVRNRWFDLVEGELRAASGLVDETSYLELFDKYVTHVSHWVKKERVVNPVTGKDEDADVDLMKSVEEKLDVDNADIFRNELLSSVAAWAIDHPEQDVDYQALFPRYIDQLRQAYFEAHQSQIGAIGRTLIALLDEDESLGADDRERAQSALNVLTSRYAYEHSSAKVAIGALIAARYRE